MLKLRLLNDWDIWMNEWNGMNEQMNDHRLGVYMILVVAGLNEMEEATDRKRKHGLCDL